MRRVLLLLLLAGLMASAGYGFSRQNKTPVKEVKTYRVYCDENFFAADRESLMYEPGSHVSLDFPTADEDVKYSFQVEGVKDFDVSYTAGKGYVVAFDMPRNYVVVRYQVDEPFAGIAIAMDENPATGFEWIVSVSSEEILKLVEDRYVSDESDEPVDGLGGTHYWKYKVIGSGVVELRFSEERGDEKISPGILYRYLCEDNQATLLETVYLEDEEPDSLEE